MSRHSQMKVPPRSAPTAGGVKRLRPTPCPLCETAAVARCECQVAELVCAEGHRWVECPVHQVRRLFRPGHTLACFHAGLKPESQAPEPAPTPAPTPATRPASKPHARKRNRTHKFGKSPVPPKPPAPAPPPATKETLGRTGHLLRRYSVEQEEVDEQNDHEQEGEGEGEGSGPTRRSMKRPCWCHDGYTRLVPLSEAAAHQKERLQARQMKETTWLMVAGMMLVALLRFAFDVETALNHAFMALWILVVAGFTVWRNPAGVREAVQPLLSGLGSVRRWRWRWRWSGAAAAALGLACVVLGPALWLPGAHAEPLRDLDQHCEVDLRGTCRSYKQCPGAPIGVCNHGLICCPPTAPPPPASVPQPAAGLPLWDASCAGNVNSRLGTLWTYFFPEEHLLGMVPVFKETYFDCRLMRDVTPPVPLRAWNVSVGVVPPLGSNPASGADGPDEFAAAPLQAKAEGWLLHPTGTVGPAARSRSVPKPPHWFSISRAAHPAFYQCGMVQSLLATLAVETARGHVVPAMAGHASLTCEEALMADPEGCRQRHYDLRVAEFEVVCPLDAYAQTCPATCVGTELASDGVSSAEVYDAFATWPANGMCLEAEQCRGSGGVPATVEGVHQPPRNSDVSRVPSCHWECASAVCCLFGQDPFAAIQPDPAPSPSPSPSPSPLPSPSPSPSPSPPGLSSPAPSPATSSSPSASKVAPSSSLPLPSPAIPPSVPAPWPSPPGPAISTPSQDAPSEPQDEPAPDLGPQPNNAAVESADNGGRDRQSELGEFSWGDIGVFTLTLFLVVLLVLGLTVVVRKGIRRGWHARFLPAGKRGPGADPASGSSNPAEQALLDRSAGVSGDGSLSGEVEGIRAGGEGDHGDPSASSYLVNAISSLFSPSTFFGASNLEHDDPGPSGPSAAPDKSQAPARDLRHHHLVYSSEESDDAWDEKWSAREDRSLFQPDKRDKAD